MNKKITLVRLEKESTSLLKDPLPQALVSRTQTYSFHFCLHSLEEDFTGGFYFGVLKLTEDYPFSPPKIWFITESGRFEVEKAICTTFTHYHKQTWSASWNIRTMLTALVSFMYTNQKGVGGLYYSSSRRKALAKKSLKSNLANPLFKELFMQTLLDRSLLSPDHLDDLLSQIKKEEEDNQDEKKLEQYSKTVMSEKHEVFGFQNPFSGDSQEQSFRKNAAKQLIGNENLSKSNKILLEEGESKEGLWPCKRGQNAQIAGKLQ